MATDPVRSSNFLRDAKRDHGKTWREKERDLEKGGKATADALIAHRRSVFDLSKLKLPSPDDAPHLGVRVERLHEHLVQGALLQPVERVGGVHIPILLLALHVVRARASDDRLRSGEGNTQMAMIKL